MSNNAATMPAATEDKPREPSQMVFARMHRDAITANLETSGAQAVYLSYVKRFVAVHLALQELWRMGSMPSERRATWSRRCDELQASYKATGLDLEYEEIELMAAGLKNLGVSALVKLFKALQTIVGEIDKGIAADDWKRTLDSVRSA